MVVDVSAVEGGVAIAVAGDKGDREVGDDNEVEAVEIAVELAYLLVLESGVVVVCRRDERGVSSGGDVGRNTVGGVEYDDPVVAGNEIGIEVYKV